MTGNPTPERVHDRHNNLETAVARTLYPTPSQAMCAGYPSDEAKERPTAGGHRRGHSGNELLRVVRREAWPTPKASDGPKGGPNMRNGSGTQSLPSAVHGVELDAAGDQLALLDGASEPQVTAAAETWPTPTARDWRSGKASDATMARNARPLSEVVVERARRDWPTPTAGAGGPDFARADRSESGGDSLPTAVARSMWPTPDTAMGRVPRCESVERRGRTLVRRRDGAKVQERLETAVRWPTPMRQDARHDPANAANRAASGRAMQLAHVVGAAGEVEPSGTLNPDWVEALMGWPAGWTSLVPLPDDEFRRWEDGFGELDPPQPSTGGGRRRYGVEAWRDGTWEEGLPRTTGKQPHRLQRLAAIGDGQVPLVLAVAVEVLAERAADEVEERGRWLAS